MNGWFVVHLHVRRPPEMWWGWGSDVKPETESQLSLSGSWMGVLLLWYIIEELMEPYHTIDHGWLMNQFLRSIWPNLQVLHLGFNHLRQRSKANPERNWGEFQYENERWQISAEVDATNACMLGVQLWGLKISSASSICHNLIYCQIWPFKTSQKRMGLMNQNPPPFPSSICLSPDTKAHRASGSSEDFCSLPVMAVNQGRL